MNENRQYPNRTRTSMGLISIGTLSFLVACTQPRGPTPRTGEHTMTTLLEVRHVTVSIARPPSAVYAFLSKVENVPQWASGLAAGVKQVNGEWLGEGPNGPIKIRFVRENDLGVLDHDVVMASGETVHNPMRVVPNGAGSEVTFTLFRRPGVTSEQFASDIQWVEKDLRGLKTLLERSPAPK